MKWTKEASDAMRLDEQGPTISFDKCLFCGSCIRQCPTGTISEEKSGYRILVGGKLGRHPRLAEDMGEIFPVEALPRVVDTVVEFYKRHCKHGERLSGTIERQGIEGLVAKMKNRGLLT